MQTAWAIEAKYADANRLERFASEHQREYVSLFTNLDRIVRHLSGGAKIGGFQIGFFRSEGGDVWRIGQTGVPHAKESRLYIYPDQNNHKIYILTAGTKDRQSDDIKSAKETTNMIKGSIANPIEPEVQ
jgi:hypothetical protein